MQRETSISSTTVAFLFTMAAVVTAVVILAITVFTGRAASFEDATRFDQHEAPDVRYVMNYGVDSELFSFYTMERGLSAAPRAELAQGSPVTR